MNFILFSLLKTSRFHRLLLPNIIDTYGCYCPRIHVEKITTSTNTNDNNNKVENYYYTRNLNMDNNEHQLEHNTQNIYKTHHHHHHHHIIDNNYYNYELLLPIFIKNTNNVIFNETKNVDKLTNESNKGVRDTYVSVNIKIVSKEIDSNSDYSESTSKIRDREIEMDMEMEVELPEEPTTCCMSGCENCVWIQYANELQRILNNSDKSKEIILRKISDPSMKMFLTIELNNTLKKNDH